MPNPPSKKEFVDLLNRLLGNNSMDEKKLDLILSQSKQVYDQQGTKGLFNYMQKLLPYSVDEDIMTKIWGQMQNKRGVQTWMKQVEKIKRKPQD